MNSDESLPSWAMINFNDIEVGEKIGGGGAGVIFKGFWKRQPVALKALFDPRISEELKREFMDELIVMSRVEHSNIVKFLGACLSPPNLCFVMEICECSLHHLLHVDRYHPSDYDKVQMAIDIASAMEYLHSLRPAIIHRDLKTLNVLRAFNGSLKLCDFGLVKNRNSQAGTPSYMAPELFLNKPFNKSIDVYAFGVLLWEILHEEVPFNQVPLIDIRDKVVTGQRLSVVAYGPMRRCGDLIHSCWSQNPDNRPSFTSVVDELLDIAKVIPQKNYSEKCFSGDALDGILGHK